MCFCDSFSTVDLIFTLMFPGPDERQKERDGEWRVEWLTIWIFQSGRLL